jgi:DNA-directed RNA polymerase specialized sigma24 family protein
MKTSTSSALPQEGYTASELLAQYDTYIQNQVQARFPSYVFAPDVVDLEIDEIIQIVRIKLWLTLQDCHINYPRAYIRKIVQTTIIDKMRQRKKYWPLSMNEDGEPCQGDPLIIPGKGMRDPADELEEQEVDPDRLKSLIDAVDSLPSRQQYALICRLKDNIDDTLILIHSLHNPKVDPAKVHWPEETADKQCLKASLSAVRKKLQFLLVENQAV